MARQIRQLSVFFLLVVLLVQTTGRTLVYVHYLLNKKYISETLCVNQDKPALSCEGQCHLKKTMEQEATKDANLPLLKEKFEVLICSIPIRNLVCSGENPGVSYYKGLSPKGYSYLVPNDVFHPPRLF